MTVYLSDQRWKFEFIEKGKQKKNKRVKNGRGENINTAIARQVLCHLFNGVLPFTDEKTEF